METFHAYDSYERMELTEAIGETSPMASVISGDPSSKAEAPSTARKSAGSRGMALLAAAAGFLVSFCCLAVFWFREVRHFYSPSGDEFSLLVNSARPFHPSISAWFLHGFSTYFTPYPDWAAPETNFLRPVANAVYYLNSVLFGSHWSRYLLSNYVIESAVIAAAVYLSVRWLRMRRWNILLIGLVCFFSPAFDHGARFSTAFPFDLLAAVFVLTGLSLLLSRRLVLAWICLTVGIFTKETALFAPLAAGLAICGLLSRRGWRRYLAPGCFLIPYAMWLGLRWFAFRGTTGIYAVGPTSILRLGKNLLRWPFPFESPLGARFAFGLLPLSFSVCVFAALNLCFWGIGVLLLVRFVRSSKISGGGGRIGAARFLDSMGLVSAPEKILCLFCAGSSAMLLLLPNLQPRFGATFLPLFAMVLAVVFEKSVWGWLRATALFLLVVPLGMNATLRGMQLGPDVRAAHRNWAMAADYVHKISQSTSPVIFTVDDVTGGYSSTASIKKFTGYGGRLIRIDDVLLDPNCEAIPRIDLKKIALAEISIRSAIASQCAGHTFPDADITPIGGRSRLRKIGSIEIAYAGMPALPAHSISVPGQLRVEIAGAPAGAILLLPDFQRRGYSEVRLGDIGVGSPKLR